MLIEDRKLLLENIGISTWKEQDEIFDHEARIKLVAGGERAGKSFLGALYVIAVTKADVVRKWIVYVGDSAH